MDGEAPAEHKHPHFAEEEVKGHEEGHILKDLDTHFEKSKEDPEVKPEDLDQETKTHLEEAERNTEKNAHVE